METTIEGLGFRVYSPPKVEYGVIWGSYYNSYPKPCSIYLRGTIHHGPLVLLSELPRKEPPVNKVAPDSLYYLGPKYPYIVPLIYSPPITPLKGPIPKRVFGHLAAASSELKVEDPNPHAMGGTGDLFLGLYRDIRVILEYDSPKQQQALLGSLLSEGILVPKRAYDYTLLLDVKP